MAANPTFLGRMLARIQGEIPATTLEAYRRASLPVFELLDQVEARRLACATEGLDPWTIPPATRTEFLCAWNAFVLQSLGNDILDADYAEYPATAGFVPPPTGEQVLAFYVQVEPWLNRAQQAHANPAYRLDVDVPAELPAWVEGVDLSPTHLLGMLQALRSLGDHAAAAMGFLPEKRDDPAEQAQLNHIRQLYASAQTKARYAADLHGTGSSPDVHDRLEPYAREAIALFHQVGQLIADPTLAATAEPDGEPRRAGKGRGKKGKGRLLPGQPGFDEWCLTDPDARARLQGDPKARKALQQMWRKDPEPTRTLGIQADIKAAMDRGDVAYAMSRRGRIGHFWRCPWGPVYVAKKGLMLGGTRLTALQQFVFEVSAEGMGRGEPFCRQVSVGVFHPTDEVGYR